MKPVKIKEIMTAHPTLIAPDALVADAAGKMQSVECGCLPVGNEGEAIGMITDRDIALRVVAEGRDPARTKVSEVMSKGLYTIDENDDLDDAASQMQAHGVGRLIVTSRKKVVGIVTMAEILRAVADSERSPKILRELAKTRFPAHAAH